MRMNVLCTACEIAKLVWKDVCCIWGGGAGIFQGRVDELGGRQRVLFPQFGGK